MYKKLIYDPLIPLKNILGFWNLKVVKWSNIRKLLRKIQSNKITKEMITSSFAAIIDIRHVCLLLSFHFNGSIMSHQQYLVLLHGMGTEHVPHKTCSDLWKITSLCWCRHHIVPNPPLFPELHLNVLICDQETSKASFN